MKKIFKKVMASAMAVTSLAVGITGINASAYYTSRSFGSGSTAKNATYSNYVKAETDTTLSNTYIKVQITQLNSFVLDNDYISTGTTDHVETIAYELGINKSKSYHQERMTSYNYTNITMNA